MSSSSEQSPSEVLDPPPVTASSRPLSRTKSSADGVDSCRVCGDGQARMHYGVLTCFGCKGFFRRTLKRPNEYTCRHLGRCVVDRHERNSCRYCRFQKCLAVGMDPKAVRPDRDATGRHFQGRVRRAKLQGGEVEEAPVDGDWSRKLPVDMRTTLMQLMNVELVVNSGDSNFDAKKMYPLQYSIRQLLEDPSLLDGKRTEMRYESFRKVEGVELPAAAHRGLLAAIDWVDHLFDIMDVHSTDDKLTLVKHGFAPLSLFSICVATAKATKNRDILCLCNFGYVPRDVDTVYEEPYHLANKVVDRCLDDLVDPFRGLNLKEEEATLLKAIILLNPYLKALSQEAAETIADLRDRIQETLYHVVRETHPKEVASSRFGNLLLFCPSIMILGNVMCENLQFAQTFGSAKDVDKMLAEVLADIEPADSHPISVDQVLAAAPRSRMQHSESSSSISSLASHDSSSSYESPKRHSLGGGYSSASSSSSLSSLAHHTEQLNTAASMPNLEASDTDPDYNITLTADMFSGMRQAISVAQAMDLDPVPQQMRASSSHSLQTPPNSPCTSNGMGGLVMGQPRPQFFIEDPQRVTMTVESARHKFTVTTERGGSIDHGEEPLLPISGGVPLCKTNSLPLTGSSFPSFPQPTFQDINYHHNPNSMDFEESHFYQ